MKNIDLEKGLLQVTNKKNDTVRTVVLSSKAVELISIIRENTISRGITIEGGLWLFGGHNVFKSGKPHSFKELGTLMRRFRKAYPQFAGRTLYEQKHTSIRHQFNNGVDHYLIKERANHSSIGTTEIYLQSTRLVEDYEFNLK
ncbi:tyrosine-type recombinase/integrase [Pedobacter ginsengisoli]|uniref:tyrosine-type recombinase/integrase n=1 Tax=Pedobacter ginsengisoli TaxID=363852 RepID=UPI0012FD75D4|nr:tyrosine-type recombinase/integrase [Pedobacter ginsengisoli]